VEVLHLARLHRRRSRIDELAKILSWHRWSVDSYLLAVQEL
jgi:hypothetical protein